MSHNRYHLFATFFLASIALQSFSQPSDKKIAAIDKELISDNREKKWEALNTVKQFQSNAGIDAAYPLIPALVFSHTHAPDRKFQVIVEEQLKQFTDHKKLIFYYLEGVKRFRTDAKAQSELLIYCGNSLHKRTEKDSVLVPVIIDFVIRQDRDLSQQSNAYTLLAAVQLIDTYYYRWPGEKISISTAEVLEGLLYKPSNFNYAICEGVLNVLPMTKAGMLASLKFMNTKQVAQMPNPFNYVNGIERHLTPQWAKEKEIEKLLINMIDHVKNKDDMTDMDCCRMIKMMGSGATVLLPYLRDLKYKPGQGHAELKRLAKETVEYLESL